MSGRRRTGFAAAACLLAALAGGPARAQEAAPAPEAAPAREATPAPASRWSGSATVLGYLLPDDENYLMPIVVARHDRLHLEARWNYEERDTGSLFAGWVFTAGSKVEFEAVPMLGVVAGDLDGVAPGCTFSFGWKQLFVYSENEIVFDLSDRTGSFFYNWSEITWEPLDGFGAGMVTQHTRVYETDREIQRGAMAHVTKGIFTGAVYWFNPGSADDFVVISAGVDF